MHTMHRIGPRVAAVTTCSSSPKFPLQALLLCRYSRHNYSSTSSTSGRSHATISLQSTILSRQQHAITPSFSSRHKVATSMTTTTRHLSSQNTKLAHEWIVDGKVVPQSKMEGDGIMNDDGKDVIVFLHGLLGNAKNLRTPAKKLTQQLPHLNALLLDIRGHGNSSSSSSFTQPHNFQSCVQDIFDTLSPLGLTGPNSPTAICGHSLGGRIALQYSHFLCTDQNGSGENRGMVIEPPKQTWVLDSVPGQADPSVHSVLRAISSLSTPFPSKSWVVDTLVKEHKMNKGVAMWIATNLRDGGDKKSFEWIFDLGIANELVENFTDQNFAEMIHDVTKSKADGGTNDNDKNSIVQLVMAGKNKSWSKEIVSELQSIPSFQKTTSPSPLFQMHTLDKAGHWVHVDDLEGLLKLMVEGLQER